LRRQADDVYVRRAKAEGYRSRAVYKLLEIDDKDHLLVPGRQVVDLGAAPGGWAQVASDRVGPRGHVWALDLLPMDPLPGVDFIQGDFRDALVLETLLNKVAGNPIELVMSDMAPNISGVKAVDQPRAMYLSELALDFACRILAPGGDLLVKVFQGEGFDGFVQEARRHFERVVVRKPKASRPRSPEVYLVARNYNV
jgi:23S rRNA (uridine2552-2'-O)-methyltransferase